LASGEAAADPQWNAGLMTGVCGRGADGELWQNSCWYNGLRGDVLFGRNRNTDFGLGPYAQLATSGFEDVRTSGGLSGLVPWDGFLPLVLSAGGYARRDDDTWAPGLEGWLFIGSRSYNFHSSYGIAAGLVVGYQRDLTDRGDNAIVIAAQLDGLLLSLPFIFGYSALRGSPED
jgi:hypothetical protein